MTYKKYRKEVRNYMKKIEAQLKKEYGTVAPEWDLTLEQLADSYELYINIKEQIDKDGLMKKSVKIVKGEAIETEEKHPLFPALFNTQTNINRIVNQFGFTLFAKSRMKVQPTIHDENDDYLNSL
jgi:P27 family predicted phage terminase small subunit